jgi:hypothetical protein
MCQNTIIDILQTIGHTLKINPKSFDSSQPDVSCKILNEVIALAQIIITSFNTFFAFIPVGLSSDVKLTIPVGTDSLFIDSKASVSEELIVSIQFDASTNFKVFSLIIVALNLFLEALKIALSLVGVEFSYICYRTIKGYLQLSVKASFDQCESTKIAIVVSDVTIAFIKLYLKYFV